MKLNLKRIKKIATDDHTTTLQTHDGHRVVVSHKSLHPATRGALAALPLVGEGKINAMAEGGQVQQGGPEVARKECYEDGGAVEPQYDQYGRKVEPKPKSTGSPGIDKGSAEGIQKGATSPGWSGVKKTLGFAEGTPDGPIQVASEPEAPLIPDDLANPNPGAQFAASQNPVTEIPAERLMEQKAEDLPYGITPQSLVAPQGQAPQQAQPQQPQMEASAAQPKPQQAPQGAQPDPYGTNAYQDSYMQGLNSEKAGLVKEAQANDAVGQAQAAMLGKQQAIQAQQVSEYQTHMKSLNTEREALLSDIQNQHIDPNHFINTQDGASRIATAIGLIASGMGSGMAHQENLAAKFLNQQINNDIEAQKAELGKKENLLSANMRQFGNLRDATDMTRVMQTDILANQLKQAAAKQQSPLAQANLLKAMGQLEMQSAPVLSQMAMRKTLLSGAAKGQIAPESVIRMVVPENEQAGATKELKEAQSAYRAKDNVLSAFDKIAELNTVGNRVMSPFQSSRQISALRDPVVASLSKETAGRFTEQDAHMLQTLFPAAGDNAETIAMKRGQTTKLVNEKLNFPELKKWGIDLSNTGRYNSAGRSRIPESAPKQK